MKGLRSILLLAASAAFALAASPATAQKVVTQGNVPAHSICFGKPGATATCVDPTDPLPVTIISGGGGGGGSGDASAANQTAVQAPIAPATATATKSTVVGTVYNSTPPTFSNGQQGAIQIDANGRVIVNLASSTILGAPGDSTCATDTGSCAVNAKLSRIAERLTSIISSLSTIDGRVDGLEALLTCTGISAYDGTNNLSLCGLNRTTADAARDTATAVPVTDNASSLTVDATTGAPLPTIGFAGTATTTVTRPSDANALAAADAWADSTSAPTTGGFTLSSMCRASGGSGILSDLTAIYSTTQVFDGYLYIYDSAVTAVNDNAAWAMSDSDQLKLVAIVPITTVADASNSVQSVQNLNIGYTCSGSANLRFMIKVKTGYTPASADTLTIRAKFVQTN